MTAAIVAIGTFDLLVGVAPESLLTTCVAPSSPTTQSVALILKRRITADLIEQGDRRRAPRLKRSTIPGTVLCGFAVSAAEAGADIAAIQQALGHRTPTMWARYEASIIGEDQSASAAWGVGREAAKEAQTSICNATRGERMMNRLSCGPSSNSCRGANR
jgi:hypothetical protein